MVLFRASSYIQWGMHISQVQNMKLKFSMLTHINPTCILEYYHASVIINLDVLYLEDGNVHRLFLKNQNRNYVFFLKKTFSSNFW